MPPPHQAWDGAHWTGWDSRGGIVLDPILGAPLSACSWSANRIDLFAIGTDSAAWHQSLGAFHIPVKKAAKAMPGAKGMAAVTVTKKPAAAKAKQTAAPKKAAAKKK